MDDFLANLTLALLSSVTKTTTRRRRRSRSRNMAVIKWMVIHHCAG